MSLQEILDHRRAVRHFDPKKPLDSTVVKNVLNKRHWLQQVLTYNFGRLIM